MIWFACEYFLSALALEIDYSRSYMRIFKVKAGEKLSTPTYHNLFDLLLRSAIIYIRLFTAFLIKYTSENIFSRYFPPKNNSIEGLFKGYLKKISKAFYKGKKSIYKLRLSEIILFDKACSTSFA